MNTLFIKMRKILTKNKTIYKISVKVYICLSKARLFLFTSKQVFKVISVKDYCQISGDKYKLLESKQKRPVYFPRYFEDETKDKCIYYESPEIYISELNDIQVIGDNFFIINKGNCLYDIVDYPELGNAKIDYANVTDYNEIKKEISIRAYNSNQVIERGIFLIGHPSGNYYHFMIDILSKLYYVEKFDCYKDFPLLIDEKGVERFRPIIDFFNINNHSIIPIKKGYIYGVNKLIYPSRNTFGLIYSNNKNSNNHFSKLISNTAFEFYNKLVNSKQSNGHKRIYVSRLKSDRLTNEAIIAELFKSYGFEIKYLESMPFSEQLQLFSQTEYFVGVKGAGFANIIYLPKNAKVACIVPKLEDYVLFSTLAYNMSIDITYLNCQAIDDSVYYVDPDYCERWLINEGFKREF